MDCEYSKYGCTSRPSNNDHLQLHLQGLVHHHLKLLVSSVDKEVEKNKTLQATVETLQSRLEITEKKIQVNDGLENKLKDLESKLLQLQGTL